jgi:hypothetical protein
MCFSVDAYVLCADSSFVCRSLPPSFKVLTGIKIDSRTLARATCCKRHQSCCPPGVKMSGSTPLYINHSGTIFRGYAAVLLRRKRVRIIASRLRAVSSVAEASDLTYPHACHIVALEQRERALAAHLVSKLPASFFLNSTLPSSARRRHPNGRAALPLIRRRGVARLGGGRERDRTGFECGGGSFSLKICSLRLLRRNKIFFLLLRL